MYQSGLVFNTLFATLILGEPFTRYSFLGTVLVCIGAVLIATFGAIGEPAHSLGQLLQLLQRPAFVVWMVTTGGLALIILFGSKTIRYFSSSSSSSSSQQQQQQQQQYGRLKLIRGMSYGLVSGILSAHMLLLAKSAVELLVRTAVDRVNQFNRWQSWAIVVGMIVLALVQLFYLHRGLKLCSTSILYPFVFCIYNIIAILDGLIYFRQISTLDASRAGLIALGTVVLLSGVLCLSWRLDVVEPSPPPPSMGLAEEAAIASELCADRGGEREGVEEEEQEEEERADDEECRVESERELLIPSASPSVPDIVDSAYIWAELDDSDYNDDNYAVTRWNANNNGGRRPRSKTVRLDSRPLTLCPRRLRATSLPFGGGSRVGRGKPPSERGPYSYGTMDVNQAKNDVAGNMDAGRRRRKRRRRRRPWTMMGLWQYIQRWTGLF